MAGLAAVNQQPLQAAQPQPAAQPNERPLHHFFVKAKANIILAWNKSVEGLKSVGAALKNLIQRVIDAVCSWFSKKTERPAQPPQPAPVAQVQVAHSEVVVDNNAPVPAVNPPTSPLLPLVQAAIAVVQQAAAQLPPPTAQPQAVQAAPVAAPPEPANQPVPLAAPPQADQPAPIAAQSAEPQVPLAPPLQPVDQPATAIAVAGAAAAHINPFPPLQPATQTPADRGGWLRRTFWGSE